MTRNEAVILADAARSQADDLRAEVARLTKELETTQAHALDALSLMKSRADHAEAVLRGLRAWLESDGDLYTPEVLAKLDALERE